MTFLNKKTYFTLKFFIAIVALNVVSMQLYAGPLGPPGPPGGGGPPCWPPPCVPINKGLVFLAVAALLLAAYQLKIFRTKTK